MSIFFSTTQLPNANQEYVAWVDVMGIGPAMGRSVAGAANFIFKLHAVAASNYIQGITIYPIMDGFYVATADQSAMLNFLNKVFKECAKEFNSTPANQPHHRFIIRGALAYGPVIHGSSVPDAVFTPNKGSNPFGALPHYKSAIMLGMPMVQAHTSETNAPPFGLYIHESARTFAPPGQEPLHHVWWKWATKTDETWKELKTSIKSHFKWCQKNTLALEYKSERISIHQQMSEQYMA